MRPPRSSRVVMQKFDVQDGKYVLVDLGSFNGTTLNGRRIATPEVLHHQDNIELGHGGPTIRFVDPAQSGAPPGAASQLRSVAPAQSAHPIFAPSLKKMGTMVLGSGSPLQISHAGISDRPHVFIERSLDRRDNSPLAAARNATFVSMVC